MLPKCAATAGVCEPYAPRMKLPTWMRAALLATAVMNVAGSAAFLPVAAPLRLALGLPDAGHPLFPATIASFILVFGVAYGWAGVTARADHLFIAVAAAGKLAFFGLLAGFWAVGDLPAAAPMAGMGDLVFGALFAVWLIRSVRDRPSASSERKPLLSPP